MKRSVCIRTVLGSLILISATCTAFAQQPAPAAAPAARQAPQPIPLFFKEGWKNTTGLVPMAQEFVGSSDLELKMYPGSNKEDFNVTTEGNVAHIWTGLCATSCALTLKNKDNYVDLTGKARVRWTMKTSGFHEIRPVVRLADGTWLVGDHTDANTFDYSESEFYFSQVHWMKIEMDKVDTKGVLLDKVDLSKVDEFGFADLTPGSGHGNGGYSDVAGIELYGKPVKRSATDAPIKVDSSQPVRK